MRSTGRRVSEETKIKISESQDKYKIVLLDVETGIYYVSWKEVMAVFKINQYTLYDQLIGRTKKKTTNLIIV